MTTHNFGKVTVDAKKSLNCPRCGKRVRRSKQFWQTVNPFNTRADGLMKTAHDIVPELIFEAEQWRKEPEYCTGSAEQLSLEEAGNG
jgi:hypothetical protein